MPIVLFVHIFVLACFQSSAILDIWQFLSLLHLHHTIRLVFDDVLTHDLRCNGII